MAPEYQEPYPSPGRPGSAHRPIPDNLQDLPPPDDAVLAGSSTFIENLEQVLDQTPNNRRFYDAMQQEAAAHLDRPVNIARIGRQIGVSRQAAWLILRRLAEAGMDVPLTPNDPKWIERAGELVLGAYQQSEARGRVPFPQRLARELKLGTKFVAQILDLLIDTGQITGAPLEQLRQQVIALREERHLGDRAIAREVKQSASTVGWILTQEKQRRKSLGLSTEPLSVRRQRRTPAQIAEFKRQILSFRQLNYTYEQIAEALRKDLGTATVSNVQYDTRSLLEQGAIQPKSQGKPFVEQTKASWAIQNQFPHLKPADIEKRLNAAGIETNLWQVKRSMREHPAREHHQMISPDEFAQIYEQLNHRIYRFVLHKVRDSEVALDITADVFAKVYTQLPKLLKGQNGEYKLDGWIFAVARYTCINFENRERTNDTLLSVFDSDHFMPLATEPDISIDETSLALRQLEVHQRQAIRLHILDGMTQASSAKKMGLSQPTFRKLLRAGIAQLQSYYQSMAYYEDVGA